MYDVELLPFSTFRKHICKVVTLLLLGIHGSVQSFASNATNHTSKLHCRILPQKETEFQVKLCADNELCRGFIIINRTSVCDEDVPVSDDRDTDAFLKSYYGPDYYEIKFRGPEVVIARQHYLGSCMVVARYQLTVPGSHTLTIRQLYGNYEAVTEHWDTRNLTWKAQRLDKHIIQPVDDVLCLRPGLDQQNTQLPICLNGSAPGHWIALKSGWRWQPYHCSYPTLDWTPDKVQRCLYNRTITLIGDSQLRALYYALLNAISSIRIEKNPKLPNGRTDQIGNITLVYKVDVYLDGIHGWHAMLQEKLPTDIVLAGVGNWPACGNHEGIGKWPDKKYRQHVLLKAREMRQFQSTHPATMMYWVGIPAFAHPAFDTRRNNQRFLHMAESASSTMEAAGIPVIDSYAVSEGMTDTSYDGAHFDNHVTDTIAAIALHEICRDSGFEME